jgi:hypothetical protein
MNKRINYFGYCPVCSCVIRGITLEEAECSNTMCLVRAKNRGLQFKKDIIEGRKCSICHSNLYQGINCGFCANEECERYMREQ